MNLKSIFTFIILINTYGTLFSQNSPIDFEIGGHGNNWAWTVFENDENPPLEIIENPSLDGINLSEHVAKFTALQNGEPWAGCESLHGFGIGTFSLNTLNSTLKIMVYKTVISDVGLKFVIPNSGSLGEIKVSNTTVNAWEELVFDFSSHIGLPEAIDIDQIVIFPDFDLEGRTEDNIIYFDNITFSPMVVPEIPSLAAPDPIISESNVFSIFSDAYSSIASVNLNPNWGQSTTVEEVYINGNNTLLYSNLNYQGTEFSSQDISGMDFLHIDYWIDNSTSLNLFVISQTPTVDSDYYTLPLESQEWSSIDISLSNFPNIDLTDVFQLKVEGNGTIFWDNIYFYSNPLWITQINDSQPQNFTLHQNYPNPFNPVTTISYELPLESYVTVNIYDILGNKVMDVLSKNQKAGYKTFDWRATNNTGERVSAGIYFYSIESREFKQTKKMILLK